MNIRSDEVRQVGEALDSRWMAAHWMPFTGNREFKSNPRFITSAAGAYYTTDDGRQVFDGLSGLWCTGLGHARAPVVDAVSKQMATLDYSPAFQFGHRLSFELANKIVEKMPAGLNRVFFTGSGSESVDTALKMARAYWRTKGLAGKTRLIGRAKGYHGPGSVTSRAYDAPGSLSMPADRRLWKFDRGLAYREAYFRSRTGGRVGRVRRPSVVVVHAATSLGSLWR